MALVRIDKRKESFIFFLFHALSLVSFQDNWKHVRLRNDWIIAA